MNDSRIKLGQIDYAVTKIAVDLKRQESATNREVINTKRQQIVDWLKVCDPSTNHVTARKIHEPGTGNWFISSSDFVKWRDNKIRSLWLQAIPGAGKTILCSTIIDEIKEFCANRSEYRFAYFYFDFSDKKKQIVDSFVRSIIIQLFGYHQNIPIDIQSFYNTSHENQPPLDALIKILLSLLSTSSRTYILIDALDECCERGEMVDLLKHLILSSNSMNLLITSRKEQDIITKLQCHIDVVKCIQSAKVDADVELYIQNCLSRDSTLKRCLPVREQVIKALVEGANGMCMPSIVPINRL
jgi:NACHT domain